MIHGPYSTRFISFLEFSLVFFSLWAILHEIPWLVIVVAFMFSHLSIHLQYGWNSRILSFFYRLSSIHHCSWCGGFNNQFFLHLLRKKTLQQVQKSKKNVISLSSSLTLTNMLLIWHIRVLRIFKWLEIFIPSCTFRLCNCIFKLI